MVWNPCPLPAPLPFRGQGGDDLPPMGAWNGLFVSVLHKDHVTAGAADRPGGASKVSIGDFLVGADGV